MNFKRRPGERKGMIDVDIEDYKKQLHYLIIEKGETLVSLAMSINCSDKKIRNPKYTGRIKIDVYKKLEKISKKFQPKIIAPCTAGEIKQYLDEINEFNFDTKQMAQALYNYYNTGTNWHCKDGQIINRDNIMYVLNSNYERKVIKETEYDYYKVNGQKKVKKQEQKKKEPENLRFELIVESNEENEFESLREEIKQIRKRINEDINALDSKLRELQQKQRSSYIDDLRKISQKIDENEIKKHFFQ